MRMVFKSISITFFFILFCFYYEAGQNMVKQVTNIMNTSLNAIDSGFSGTMNNTATLDFDNVITEMQNSLTIGFSSGRNDVDKHLSTINNATKDIMSQIKDAFSKEVQLVCEL